MPRSAAPAAAWPRGSAALGLFGDVKEGTNLSARIPWIEMPPKETL